MQGPKLLHTLFSNTFKFMHSCRLASLLSSVHALFKVKRLSLSHLGRGLESQAKERSCIRKMDRLLGNKHLHKELISCYKSINLLLLPKVPWPVISIDWATTDKRKDWHILRATLNIQGRGLTLYQEVHPQSKANSSRVQACFLDTLKTLIPDGCKPIIVADAGFRFPWFKKVVQVGFDFVGRVRNKTSYKASMSDEWHNNCLDFYSKATSIANYIGCYFFKKSDPFKCEVVLYKRRNQSRMHLNRSGKKTNNTQSNRIARGHKDPWLLVTSLDKSQYTPQNIVSIYAKRMQIEEDFRDLKSHQFGFGLRYCHSNSAKRIEVLLLIAALACLTCWLLAISAKRTNLQYDFQSNSIRNRNVLSVIYLGCQIVRRNIIFEFEVIKKAYFTLLNYVREGALC